MGTGVTESEKKAILESLGEFLSVGIPRRERNIPFSGTIYGAGLNAYCKIGPKVLPGDTSLTMVFIVSNVSVDPEFRNRGVFTFFREAIEIVCDHLKIPLYVESAITPEMHEYLSKRTDYVRHAGFMQTSMFDKVSDYSRRPK